MLRIWASLKQAVLDESFFQLCTMHEQHLDACAGISFDEGRVCGITDCDDLCLVAYIFHHQGTLLLLAGGIIVLQQTQCMRAASMGQCCTIEK